MTNKDFMNLGLAAHWGMNLEVARKCFIRCRDMKYIDLVADTQEGLRRVGRRLCLRALSLAYQSRFTRRPRVPPRWPRGQDDGDVHGNADVH